MLATYSDAKQVKGLGQKAVWSERRQQLSLVTDSYLIVHVNVQDAGSSTPEDAATGIANMLLERN